MSKLTMTKIHIEYDIDNAAFDETPLPETKRIFAEIVERIANGSGGEIIRDINGNTIGSWKIHDYLQRYEEEEEELSFDEYLEKHNYPDGNWSIKEKPKDCYEFQDIVHEAYGNGSLAGKQGDYCCVVSLKEGRVASVSLEWDDIKKASGGIEREYYLGIMEMIE